MQTMNAMGKLENVKEEMRRNRLSTMGISEVRWKDGGDFVCDGYRVRYAGGRSNMSTRSCSYCRGQSS